VQRINNSSVPVELSMMKEIEPIEPAEESLKIEIEKDELS